MKKILFATTALVATASVAAADVTFSGYGRFGVSYTGAKAAVAKTAGTVVAADVDFAVATDLDVSDSSTDTVAEQIVALNAAVAALDLAAQQALTTTEQANIAADRVLAATALATLKGTDATAAAAAKTLITSRYRITVDGNTTTDSGVTFGAKVRMQQDSGDTAIASQNSFNAAQFYAKSGGLTLRVGNIEGALDSAAGLYGGSVGLTGLGWGNVVTGFATHDYADKGNGSAASMESLEAVYSMGDYTVHASHNGTDTELAGSATIGGVTVALGTSTTKVATQVQTLATLGGSVGGVDLGFAYGKTKGGVKHTTLSMGMDLGAATSMSAYAADDKANTTKSYGIGVVHGLGAGTSLRGGVARIAGVTSADFGVLFNF